MLGIHSFVPMTGDNYSSSSVEKDVYHTDAAQGDQSET
jgi:hypothetical protein